MNTHAAEMHRPRTTAGLAPVLVDTTHMSGRALTGLERITLELFSAEALSPLPVESVGAPFSGLAGLVAGQYISLPLRLHREPHAILLCPGFPPSLLLLHFGERIIPYIHDLFLLTRPQDLSRKARFYMAPAFRRAIRKLPRFFANSRTTATELARHARPDAEIHLYRPQVRNVFGLSPEGRNDRPDPDARLRLAAMGTLEPRKNFVAAAEILHELRCNFFPEATLDIIGREGWGDVAERLRGRSGIRLHGHLPDGEVRRILQAADIFISTSHDEGLGLPLLEVQHAGLPVIASDIPVFREVLEDSGTFIDPSDPYLAALRIFTMVRQKDWRARHAASALANIRRWNALAEEDRRQVVALLTRLAGGNGEG